MRTLRQSLQHILAEAEAGRLGAFDQEGCVYESEDGKHCAIGCLLTRAQLDHLMAHDMNSGAGVQRLEDELHCLDDYGLTVAQARALQQTHDCCLMSTLVQYLKQILNGERDSIFLNGEFVKFTGAAA